uniref:CCT domain-containing protein n=1 Tax=Zea mays TaxID=4577 RepID=B4FMM9_MAIZE|nr:unknown [Zea mays]
MDQFVGVEIRADFCAFFFQHICQTSIISNCPSQHSDHLPIPSQISFSSSMEVGIVPDNMATTDMPSSGILLTPAGAISLFSSGPPLQMPLHLASMDREARVLRYREKKKSRKFEKTIRYATRKTYAEARPRIKGRFAKRSSDMDVEVDQMFSAAALSSDGSYGTVPWF